jgi:transcriptional regulator with XRE-family HTH domain
MEERAEQVSQECLRLLAELRAKRGVSHQELADRAGLDRSYIGLLEKGRRRPTLEVAVKLAMALGVKFSDIAKKAEKASAARPVER